MNQSTNYNFNLPEGTDLVNLLTQLIPNWSSLDTLLKGVEDQAITNCTEVVSLGVHAITRSNTDGKILKWIATANYTAGDTFTIDGNLVAAATASGEALATDAIVSGAVVLAALNADESAMTIFVTGTNVASDSAKLGGELPSYYAKESDMSDVKQDITDIDNLMGSTSISAIGDGTVTGAISSIKSDLNDLQPSSVSKPYSAASTFKSVLNAFHGEIDFSKVTTKSTLVLQNNVYKVFRITPTTIYLSCTLLDSTGIEVLQAIIDSTNSSMSVAIGGGAPVDRSSSTLGVETTLVFNY